MKKTQFISFRTDESTREKLNTIATERKWTLSQLCEELIKQQLAQMESEQQPLIECNPTQA